MVGITIGQIRVSIIFPLTFLDSTDDFTHITVGTISIVQKLFGWDISKMYLCLPKGRSTLIVQKRDERKFKNMYRRR